MRCILALLAAMLVSGAAYAQQARQVTNIGLVSLHSEKMAGHVDGIREELQKLGYGDGKAIKIDAHFTDGDRPRTREVLKGFVENRVDVIVPWTTPTVQLAKQATHNIPIVMIASDPVAAGLVSGLSRPGGNITGVSMSGPDLAGKRLEFLREIKPDIKTVAFLGFSPSQGAAAFIHESEAAAKKIGIKLIVRLLPHVGDLTEALFAGMKKDGAEALVVQPFFTGHAAEISAFGLAVGLPVVADYPEFGEGRRTRQRWRESGCAGEKDRLFHRSNSSGYKAGRSSSRATDQVRIGRQREHRKEARP